MITAVEDPILADRPANLHCSDFDAPVLLQCCALCHSTGHGDPPVPMHFDVTTNLSYFPDEARRSGLRISYCCRFERVRKQLTASDWATAIRKRAARMSTPGRELSP